MTWRAKRSRWDSNPHTLTGASFRDWCNTNYATAPNVAMKVGAPGFEPGTSASRTQRSTELSHAPKNNHNLPKAAYLRDARAIEHPAK